MKFNDQTYEVLKWIVQAVMPALMTAIATIGYAVEWPATELTIIILGAITAFMGTTLGITSGNYWQDKTVEKKPYTEVRGK